MKVSLQRPYALLLLTFVAMSTSQVAMAQECLIYGQQVTLEEITVHPKGAKSFKLGLHKIPVTAQIPPQSATAMELRVDGQIAFTASRKNVWLTVVSDYASPDGTVKLLRGAALVNARVERESVVASAVLYADDVLEGENKDADEIASPIHIPCSLLTLDSVEVADEDKYAPEQPGSGWWKPKSTRGREFLRSQPTDGAPSIEISTPNCENCLQFKQVDERGKWLLVERAGRGVTITGWIRRSELKRIPDDKLIIGERGWCSGRHGGGVWGESTMGEPEKYEGPAQVRSGTKVFSDPPKGEWAIIKTYLQVRVRHYKGSEWVELRHIPGLDGSPGGSPWLHAHVPLESVSFPLPDKKTPAANQ